MSVSKRGSQTVALAFIFTETRCESVGWRLNDLDFEFTERRMLAIFSDTLSNTIIEWVYVKE